MTLPEVCELSYAVHAGRASHAWVSTSVKPRSDQTRFIIGWRLVVIGTLLPAVVGITGYLTGFILSILVAPERDWHILIWSYDLRFTELLTHNTALAAVFRASMQMGWANIHSSGVLMASLGYFGIRHGHAWAWVACAYGITWAGGNDAVATVNLYQTTGGGVPPLPILAVTFTLIGLWLTRDCLRKETLSRKDVV
jgi:hypothetical protein